MMIRRWLWIPVLVTLVAAACGQDPLCRAVFSLFAKTMRAKRGHLEDGGVELGV
jgi:hypothetical protein